MDPRDHVAGLLLAALFSALLGVPVLTTVDADEPAVQQVSTREVS